MREYVAVIFNTQQAAAQALQEIWHLHRDALLTVHGAGVIARKPDGKVVVEIDDSQFPFGAAVGAIVGTLLGALVGPAGAAIGAARGAAIGAAGGVIGGIGVDVANAQTTKEAVDQAGSLLPPSHYALVADVDESDPQPLTQAMRSRGGVLYRRNRSDVTNDKFDDFFGNMKRDAYDPNAKP
ncbi:MAG: DUF1269 domain-containing protein [Candidatus Eremiobacteraeota bacterium]|nr:DUF1269 domain-containing protein [Candidatus Eremiobacteraeota bacterium]MBV8595553.1 DUF1269 domain-containing protein [Candidatus Eremiobacteraeota bacterium]